MSDSDRYDLRDGPPTPAEFQRLRAAAGMSERPRDGVDRGLSNSVYAVRVVDTRADCSAVDVADASVTDGAVVGMARVVGDGGSVYHVCDMAVHPDHQRRGLGTALMTAVDTFVDEHAPTGAYVNLLADVDGFYERFGYEATQPTSKGMYRRVD